MVQLELFRLREWNFRIYKANPTEEDRNKFKRARNDCNAIIRRVKFSNEQKLRQKVLQCPKGSKNFWSFVKKRKEFIVSSYICQDFSAYEAYEAKSFAMREVFRKCLLNN